MPTLDYEVPKPRHASRLLLIAAWLVVLIPAAWGISQTVLRSLDLFKTTVPAASTLSQPKPS
jgi:hypothetical protein